MKTKAIRTLVILIGCIMLLLVACDTSDRQTTPILPGEIAVFNITFSPDPVYQGYSNTYYFTVMIEEVNGVGARFTSMKVEDIDGSGNSIKKDDYGENGIIRTFGTSYIEAYGRVATEVALECYDCFAENWLVRAEDDKGNRVERSAVIELIRR